MPIVLSGVGLFAESRKNLATSSSPHHSVCHGRLTFITIRGQFYPLGAVLFSNTEGYAETFKLVQSLGINYEPFIVSDSFYYDPSTGVEEEMSAPSNATLQAIAEEFPRYSQVYQERFAPIGVPGYKVV